MSRDKYYPRMRVTKGSSANTDTVPPEDLPETSADSSNVCICPYCSGRFRLKGKSNGIRDVAEDNMLSCTKCGYAWKRRSTEPRKCPRCGSYRWNIQDTDFECQKCHHVWMSTAPDGPQRCPSCRSYDWRIPPSETEYETAGPSEEILREKVCEMYTAGVGVLEISQNLDIAVLKVVNMLKKHLNVKSPRY